MSSRRVVPGFLLFLVLLELRFGESASRRNGSYPYPNQHREVNLRPLRHPIQNGDRGRSVFPDGSASTSPLANQNG